MSEKYNYDINMVNNVTIVDIHNSETNELVCTLKRFDEVRTIRLLRTTAHEEKEILNFIVDHFYW